LILFSKYNAYEVFILFCLIVYFDIVSIFL